MKATANTPAGTKVTTAQGVTGVTVGTPALTPSGHVVSVEFDAAFAHLSPAGGADYAVEELELVIEVKELKAVPVRHTTRASQGTPVVGAPWELLYDKPKAGVQIVRDSDRGVYALVCVKHLTVHRLTKLSEEGAVRKAGGWCADCSH